MTKKKPPAEKPPVRKPKLAQPETIEAPEPAWARYAATAFKDHARAANANETLRVLLEAGIVPPDQSEVDAFDAALAFLNRYYGD